jgi:DNA-binding PadR family transcriptional regulator
MDYDESKVDEMVLALLLLTMHEDRYGTRAWKSHDWAVMDRLYEQGYISDPKNTAKSVAMTEKGAKRARELFEKHFAKPRQRKNTPNPKAQD